MSNGLLKSQDIVLLCKLIVSKEHKSLKQKELSASLGINQSEVSTGLERLAKAHLIDPDTKEPNKLTAFEFLESAVKFFFPAETSEHALGIPTSIFAKPLSERLVGKGMPLVWQTAEGNSKGISLKPIHDSVPFAANKDEQLYRILSVIDAIRTFRVGRVKKEASDLLRKMILGN